METVGDRLVAAIAQRGDGTVREFQVELKRRFPKLSGTSYDTIRRYIRNKPEPSAVWIRAAAELLGVRAEWIATGRGGRTEAEERRRQFVGHAPTVAVSDEALNKVIEAAAEHYYIGGWEAAGWSVHALYKTALEGCEDKEEITEEQQRLIVFGLYRVLDFPVSHMGGDWDMIANYILTATGLFKMLLDSEPAITVEAMIEAMYFDYSPTITLESVWNPETGMFE